MATLPTHTISMPGGRKMPRSNLAHNVTFETRLAHNVNTLLAQSDKKRVLSYLSCRETYLTKLVSPRNELLHFPLSLTQSVLFYRATKELYDVIFSLQAVALRSLCESVMLLPTELRFDIYAFLLPDGEQELELGGRGATNLIPKEKIHVTQDILHNLLNSHQNAYAQNLKSKAEVPDHVFIGHEMHKELITHYFQSYKFWVSDKIWISDYWTDMWYGEIHPRKTIKHLTFRGKYDAWGTHTLVRHRKLEDMWELLTPFFRHCGEHAQWVLDIFDVMKTYQDNRRLDSLLLSTITKRFSIMDIPHPDSIKMVFVDGTLNTRHEGTLDAWIDMYRQTAQNKDVQTFPQRLGAYESMQQLEGRQVYKFQAIDVSPSRLEHEFEVSLAAAVNRSSRGGV